MKKIITTVFLAALMGCHSSINIPTTNIPTTMEKFDIEAFQKNKTGNEWEIEGEDINTRKLYSYYDDTYGEVTIYKKKFYSELKTFYSTGNLKTRGKYYEHNGSSFRVGIWEYYDTDGKPTKTVDEDQGQKINYKEAFRIARKHGFYPENVYVFSQFGY